MKTPVKIIQYWSDGSKQDFETAEILYQNKKFVPALFFCHLCLEKKLKALIIKNAQSAPPFSHDLVRLVEKTNIPVDKIQKTDYPKSPPLILQQDTMTSKQASLKNPVNHSHKNISK